MRLIYLSEYIKYKVRGLKKVLATVLLTLHALADVTSHSVTIPVSCIYLTVFSLMMSNVKKSVPHIWVWCYS